jgi:hypothetical protein
VGERRAVSGYGPDMDDTEAEARHWHRLKSDLLLEIERNVPRWLEIVRGRSSEYDFGADERSSTEMAVHEVIGDVCRLIHISESRAHFDALYDAWASDHDWRRAFLDELDTEHLWRVDLLEHIEDFIRSVEDKIDEAFELARAGDERATNWLVRWNRFSMALREAVESAADEVDLELRLLALHEAWDLIDEELEGDP